MTTKIERKQAEVDDAKGWLNDLEDMNASQADIVNADRYLKLMQDDLRKLKEQEA